MKRFNPCPQTGRGVLLVCLTALLGGSGCVSYKLAPAQVTATTIANPTLGLRGYTLPIPEGFSASTNYQAVAAQRVVLDWYKHFLREGTSEFAQSPGQQLRYNEKFELAGDSFAVLFEAAVFKAPWPSSSSLRPEEKRQMLNNCAVRIHNAFATSTLEKNGLRLESGRAQILNFKDRMVGHVTGQLTLQEGGTGFPVAYETCFLLGYTDDVYALVGVADGPHRERLAEVVRDLAGRLRL